MTTWVFGPFDFNG